MTNSKIELSSVVDSVCDFLETFEKTSKCLQIPLPKPKAEIGSKKSKHSLFAYYYTDNIEHPNRQYRLSFRFENNNSCVFFIKRFELHSNRFFLTEIAKPNHREIHHLHRKRYYVAKKMWNKWEQLRCVAHSPLIVGITIALLISLGTSIVWKQSVRVNFACTKRLFYLSAEAIINVRNAHLCVRRANFFLKIKQKRFSCRLDKDLFFLKKDEIQFKMLMDMSLFQASNVSTEGKANLLTVM